MSESQFIFDGIGTVGNIQLLESHVMNLENAS